MKFVPIERAAGWVEGAGKEKKLLPAEDRSRSFALSQDLLAALSSFLPLSPLTVSCSTVEFGKRTQVSLTPHTL